MKSKKASSRKINPTKRKTTGTRTRANLAMYKRSRALASGILQILGTFLGATKTPSLLGAVQIVLDQNATRIWDKLGPREQELHNEIQNGLASNAKHLAELGEPMTAEKLLAIEEGARKNARAAELRTARKNRR